MPRIYERETDAVFAAAFDGNPAFSRAFLSAIDGEPGNRVVRTERQTRHRGPGQPGTIDLEITRADRSLLLVENKIDAAYSVTRSGDPQPARYLSSIKTLRARGEKADAVLLAPKIYLESTRHASAFDHHVSYELLRPTLTGEDLALLDAAIAQAATPYEPVPNFSSAAFFADYEAFARQHFPELHIKRNPNGNGVRPEASRTIYFNVRQTLRSWPRLPRPRMSLQCRDSAAPSASVKIMLGGWRARAGTMSVPKTLASIGGYIRPAGQSLGLVIDTPELDTQMPFDAQVPAVEEGLQAARRLAAWWNREAGALPI